MLQFTFKSEKVAEYRYLFLMIVTIGTCILIYVPILFLLFEAMDISVAAILGGVSVIPLSSMILSTLLFFKGRYEVVNKQQADFLD